MIKKQLRNYSLFLIDIDYLASYKIDISINTIKIL